MANHDVHTGQETDRDTSRAMTHDEATETVEQDPALRNSVGGDDRRTEPGPKDLPERDED
ncbi:hypothetical protein [Mangrovihabitans endophyticus]|uniref:Uncharacterized protein n=1 Tax=Mangrovihabitans endophyticus TaxID=1751298 RepID=A0A8J3FQS2_9ACTN|nr:hypothetical protein [Mangrovihabitans endophyticus]GGL05837.1 hypothetical protein GCM10012284_45200 [Mangrovihabitans endophyticus]